MPCARTNAARANNPPAQALTVSLALNLVSVVYELDLVAGMQVRKKKEVRIINKFQPRDFVASTQYNSIDVAISELLRTYDEGGVYGYRYGVYQIHLNLGAPTGLRVVEGPKSSNLIDDIDIDSDEAPLPTSWFENNDDDDSFAEPYMPSNPSSPHPKHPYVPSQHSDDVVNISDDNLVSSGSDEFLDIDEISTKSHRKPRLQQASPPAPARSSSRPVRTRKPTSKQA